REDHALISAIGRNSNALGVTLERLDQSVGRELALRAELAKRVDSAVGLHRDLVEQLTPLLDDATLDLETGYRSLGDAEPQPLETRFAERAVLTYAAMSQRSSEANLIGVLLAEATDLQDAAMIPPLVDRFQSSTDRFDGAIALIGPGGLQSVQDAATELIA